MIPAWPSTLPKPTRSGFQQTPVDQRRKRGTDAGVPRYGKRFSLAAQTVALGVILDRGQKQVFDHFYQVTLSAGTQTFWMPDPISDGWPLATEQGEQLLSPDGAPLLMASRWLCLMGEETPLTGPLKGLEFPVSFSVVVMP
ncbi:MAG: hypothetical protein ACRBB0_25685 [Pelagimonas sp.]|uniref:hypothetical protein n=1 Tax=Pelagimonas sp. TaxID=2073170 RepID=UPI003D6B09CE